MFDGEVTERERERERERLVHRIRRGVDERA